MSSQVSVSRDDLEAIAQLVDHLRSRVDEAFAEGYTLGYGSGYDHGEYQTELAEAEAWSATVRQLKADPEKGWERRLARTEAHGRALALTTWSDPKAWESARWYAPEGLIHAVDALQGRP